MTIGSAPRTGCSEPSSDNSPSISVCVKSMPSNCPDAIRMLIAIGKSNARPSFRWSAGARFTVRREMGMVNPLLTMAALTRSRLSLTDASGSPIISSAGIPVAA